MKNLSPALQAHLDSGTTTLCECWRLTLRSGEIMGFTDHDDAVVFDGTTFEAQAGFTGSEIHSSTGFSVDNLEASGALKSGQLDEVRLKAGDFDHAKIEIWRVNWQVTSQRILQRKGNLGEVSYGQGHFNAEVRGLAHFLNQPKGRLFQHSCDADLGDARCGAVVPSVPATIVAVRENNFDIAGISSFADDWFTRGTLLWTTGVNASRSLAIKRHRIFSSTARIDLWHTPKFSISVGETVFFKAGCDKLFSTCTTKFGNTLNFRGMPHMPGRDFVLKVASAGDTNNSGGRLV
jgi:uncharacterized phage protein (TIGR02218 family)